MAAVSGTAASVGASFTSLTVTWNVFVSLRLGVPLSVTRTVMLYTPGPWASVGVQVKAPVLGLMLAPAGASAWRLEVGVVAGRGAAVVVGVKVGGVPWLTVVLPMATSTGA